MAGGDGWRSTSRFDLQWTNPPGQVAPIVRAHYRLCRAGGGACVTGAAEGEGISAASVRVPDPGEWHARVWLEDAAGNQDSARAGDAVRLRFDDEAPTAVFAEQGPMTRAPCGYTCPTPAPASRTARSNCAGSGAGRGSMRAAP